MERVKKQGNRMKNPPYCHPREGEDPGIGLLTFMLEIEFLSSMHKHMFMYWLALLTAPWIPAFAGMTEDYLQKMFVGKVTIDMSFQNFMRLPWVKKCGRRCLL